MERSYFEIKVTVVHIFVLLVAVIAIGILLFYMGYQAGQKSVRGSLAVNSRVDEAAQTTEVSEPALATEKPAASSEPSIREEARLHQVGMEPPAPGPAAAQPAASETEKRKPAAAIPAPVPAPVSKPSASRESFTIQVGAFADQRNAKKYADRYTQLDYTAEISTKTINGRTLYTVRVGRFATLAEAKRELAKLEQLENKKFQIEKTR